MKNKRASSHVGVVLSFVIFVTFLVFIVTIIQPTISIDDDQETELAYLKGFFLEEISSDLTSATIVIKKDIPQNCVEFENFLVNSRMKPPFIVARGTDGNKQVYSSSDGNSLWIIKGGTEDIFFKVYNSSVFSEISTGEGACETLKEAQGDYDVGLLKTERYILESRILEIVGEYGEFGSSGYGALKDRLNVPPQSEFSFSFTNSEGTVTDVDGREQSKSVYTEEFVIQYIDTSAETKTGTINLRIW